MFFQNMGSLVNALIEPSRNKLDTLEKILHNGEVFILGIVEVNSNRRTLPLKNNLYHRTDVWYKTQRIKTTHNKNVAGYGIFQSVGTATISMNEIACHVLDSKDDPREFVRWSSILLLGGGVSVYASLPPTATLQAKTR